MYEAKLREFFGGQPPRLDLVLLGLGHDGHTASLFPGTAVLKESERWAAAIYVAEQDLYRVTLTAPLINQAAVVAFLVTGSAKAGVLREVLHGPQDPARLPALFAGARALVLPSLDRSETFGVVQLEAMASGLPVIASDLPTGVREVGLPDRTCLLVKPGDSLALREAMRRLLTDPSLAEAMGEQARCRFQAEFTQDRMLARLVAWYRGILDSPTGGAS